MPESKTPMGRGSIRGILGASPARYPSALVVKVWLAALATALVLVGGDAAGSTAARQDVSIAMDDGVSIAATLYVPDGAAPAGGWPALVFLHGLSGNRQQMNALVEGYGVHGTGLRRPHVRCARARRVGRARRDRRPARGRRHPRRPRLARRATRRLRHEDRRLGHLLRRRRRSSTRSSPAFRGRPSSPSRRGPTSTPRSCRRAS